MLIIFIGLFAVLSIFLFKFTNYYRRKKLIKENIYLLNQIGDDELITQKRQNIMKKLTKKQLEHRNIALKMELSDKS